MFGEREKILVYVHKESRMLNIDWNCFVHAVMRIEPLYGSIIIDGLTETFENSQDGVKKAKAAVRAKLGEALTTRTEELLDKFTLFEEIQAFFTQIVQPNADRLRRRRAAPSAQSTASTSDDSVTSADIAYVNELVAQQNASGAMSPDDGGSSIASDEIGKLDIDDIIEQFAQDVLSETPPDGAPSTVDEGSSGISRGDESAFSTVDEGSRDDESAPSKGSPDGGSQSSFRVRVLKNVTRPKETPKTATVTMPFSQESRITLAKQIRSIYGEPRKRRKLSEGTSVGGTS